LSETGKHLRLGALLLVLHESFLFIHE